MADYGLKYDKQEVISGSIFLFRSGALADSSTAISASSNQVIAITCSAIKILFRSRTSNR